MNAIKNFARDYGQEEYGNAYGQNLESEFRSCVQSVIGDKGDVIDAWNDGGSEGYAEWHCSIKNVEGMAPDTEFMLTLVTDLENGHSWLTCQYDTADCDVLGEADGHVGDFDPFPLIDKCLKQAGKSESKKNERGSTNIETYDGFEELLGYADAEYLLEDVVDVLSKYYTYEGEGDDIVFDEDQAKGDSEFSIKIEGGDERADFYSENIFYVHLPNKEAAEELAKVLGGKVSESKKHSEKRTVTIPAVSYDVFTYDELSDQAKETAREKVRDRILQWRGDDSDVFTDSCVTTLNELFPNSDLNVQYSLSYCQGDGLNTSGKLKVDDLLNVDLTAYPLNGSGIKPLEDKEAIKAACEKADVTSLDLPENRRYGYSMADRIEVVPDYDVELTDGETALLNELEKFAQDVMGRINNQLEDDGYNWFYEVTDEDIQEEISSQELEFTEDGEIE